MHMEREGVEKAVIYLEDTVNIVNSGHLKDILQELYDDDVIYISIDFSQTKNIDSSCLGKLLLFQKKLKERDGELQIVNITSEHILNWFNMIQLNKVISFS